MVHFIFIIVKNFHTLKQYLDIININERQEIEDLLQSLHFSRVNKSMKECQVAIN